MKLTVVGSGTAAPEPDRVCSALFLEVADTRILLDCGPGAVHHMARFRLSWQRIDHLVVTHFHNDHIGDIPTLFFALKWGTSETRSAAMKVWGPAGLQDRFDRMAAAFGDHVGDPGFPVQLIELRPGSGPSLADGVSLASARTAHTNESLAYRIQTASGPSLGYTGDTGADPALGIFLAGVDLLVAECAFPDDEARDNHLTPSSLAALARAADPGRLLVTHVYPSLAAQDIPGLLRAAGWTGETTRAEDGLEIRLGTGAEPG